MNKKSNHESQSVPESDEDNETFKNCHHIIRFPKKMVWFFSASAPNAVTNLEEN